MKMKFAFIYFSFGSSQMGSSNGALLFVNRGMGQIGGWGYKEMGFRKVERFKS